MGLRRAGVVRAGFRRGATNAGGTLAATYSVGASSTDETITLDATRGGLTIDGTGIAVEPLTIKNANAGGGITLQATGTPAVRTAFVLKDATPTTRGTFGVAVAANDYITGTAAGDIVLLSSASKTTWLGPSSGATAQTKISAGGLTVVGAAGGSISHSTTTSSGLCQIFCQNDAGKLFDMVLIGSAGSGGNNALSSGNASLFSTTATETNIAASASPFVLYTGGGALANRVFIADTSQRMGVGVFSALVNKFTVSGGIELQSDTFTGSGSGFSGTTAQIRVWIGGAVVATFNSTGLVAGSGGAGSLNAFQVTDRNVSLAGIGTTSNVLVAEWVVNLDNVQGGATGPTIKCNLDVDFTTTSITGTGDSTWFLSVRVGGTTPNTVGGTERALLSKFGAATNTLDGNLGAAFANPGGRVLVQLCAKCGSAGDSLTLGIRSLSIQLG